MLALANRTDQQPEFTCRNWGKEVGGSHWPTIPRRSLCEKMLNDFSMLMSYLKPRRPLKMTCNEIPCTIYGIPWYSMHYMVYFHKGTFGQIIGPSKNDLVVCMLISPKLNKCAQMNEYSIVNITQV